MEMGPLSEVREVLHQGCYGRNELVSMCLLGAHFLGKRDVASLCVEDSVQQDLIGVY